MMAKVVIESVCNVPHCCRTNFLDLFGAPKGLKKKASKKTHPNHYVLVWANHIVGNILKNYGRFKVKLNELVRFQRNSMMFSDNSRGSRLYTFKK